MDYTLHHGDCLEVLPTLAANSVDAIVTDPPYSSGGRQQAIARQIISKSDRPGSDWFLGDNMGTDSYIWFMRQIAQACIKVARMGAHAYVFTDWRQYSTLVAAWETVGWTLRGVVVWDKARGGAMGSFWRNNHEWVAIFSKGAPAALPHGGFFNTWTGTKPQAGYHPTEKPVELMRYIVQAVSGTVLDPFMGSGTTGVSCRLEGRQFIGIEIDRGYYDVAERRILQTTKIEDHPLLALAAD